MPPGRSVADILEEFWGEMPSWSGRYAQCVGTLNRVVNSRASGAIVGSKIALDAACGYVGFADGKSLYAVARDAVASAAQKLFYPIYSAQ